MAAALVGLICAAGCGSGAAQDGAESAAVTKPEKKPPTFADTIDDVRSGVVRIEVDTCDGASVGTGFLIGSRLVATVEHVVDGATAITLKRAGKRLASATVIGEDRARDLALLRTSVPIQGYRFTFAPRAPRLGEDVAALGYPLGLPFSVTRGSVSGSDRSIPIDGVTRRKLIQTDAAVSPGNSGGPLLVPGSKEVVGLVDLDATTADGIAFAVSAEVARPLLEAWKVAPQPSAFAACKNYDPGAVASSAPPPATPPPTASNALTTFLGDYFQIDYPAHWTVETAEVSKGSYLDTTIRDPAVRARMLRIDVSPKARSADPLVEAEPVVSALRGVSGYRELAHERTIFLGYDALYWEFLVPESGQLLHKIDIIFIDEYGEGVAVLTQAPEAEWDSWMETFAHIRETLRISG